MCWGSSSRSEATESSSSSTFTGAEKKKKQTPRKHCCCRVWFTVRAQSGLAQSLQHAGVIYRPDKWWHCISGWQTGSSTASGQETCRCSLAVAAAFMTPIRSLYDDACRAKAQKQTVQITTWRHCGHVWTRQRLKNKRLLNQYSAHSAIKPTVIVWFCVCSASECHFTFHRSNMSKLMHGGTKSW